MTARFRAFRRIGSLLILAVCLCATVIFPRSAGARGYVRWAYYVPDDPRSYQSLSANHAYLDIVAPDAWRLWPDGTITSRVQPGVIRQMRAWGLKVVPMVQQWNWNDSMHSLLASPAARSRTATALANLVINGNYDGINLDIENIQSRDGPAMEALAAEIAARLHASGRLATMTLPALTTGRYGDRGFNYSRLGRIMDYVVVMAYDYGYAGGSPMPVAPINWVRSVAAYATSQIPTGKILLGVPFYGYDWNTTTGAMAPYVSFGQAASKGGTRGYDPTAQAPYVYYRSGGQRHTIWHEDAQSVQMKLGEVVGRGLAGWAAWRLGYDDPAIWRGLSPRR